MPPSRSPIICSRNNTLNEAVPANASATLVVGDLAIPLRSPAMWTISLEPGQMYDFRLHTRDNAPVDISLSPPTAATPRLMAPLRAPASPPDDSGQSPLWQNPKDALNGPTRNTSGQLAVPELDLNWIDPGDGSHATGSAGICLHSVTRPAMFRAVIRPNGTGVTEQDLVCEGMEESGTLFGLFLSGEPDAIATGSVSFAPKDLRWGNVTAHVTAHRAWHIGNGAHCAICNVVGEHIDDVSLSVRTPLTLKHDNEADITFHCERSGHGSASSPAIVIRRVGTTDWETLAESFQYEWTARIAGFFELKGVAKMDGATVETVPVEVEVRYPTYDEVFSDADVLAICDDLWDETKGLCTTTQRQEVGCWILLDTTTGEYVHDEIKHGTIFDNEGVARVSLPMKPLNQIIELSPAAAGARYPVATVHTHTPTVHRSTGRPVGPSGRDIPNAGALAAPCAVIDYLPAYDPQRPGDTNRIPANHPIDSATKIWKIGFPNRRPTPYVPIPQP